MKEHDSAEVAAWIDAMAERLRPLFTADPEIRLVGIRRGGVDIARQLGTRLGTQHKHGELDVAFYRDDFDRIGLHPVVGPSTVPFDLDDRHIVLIDDVLASGRTVRAAMNELFDHGRPSRITLAVLVQRDNHELPIRADVIGHALDAAEDDYVELDAAALVVRVGRREELSPASGASDDQS